MNNHTLPYSLSARIFLSCSLLLLLHCSCRDIRQHRLAHASSPYLQQHATNPVDWYEWSEEALAVAKKENKPLLISIGYSSCHWCHMMEKESFMDTAVARFMNENFVCIVVDREERPDIDMMYSNACQLITGSSGWPLNAFALPDGKPFFAGTYYSKQSWLNVLKQISSAYKTQKRKVDLQAQSLSNGVANLELSVLSDTPSNVADKISYRRFFEDLYQKMDLSDGGLKGTPKFPIPGAIEFLLQYYSLAGDTRALDAANTSLTKMAFGGIYDQIGGGFARYAIDSEWQIPHFEKMLNDNAQLLSVYSHAYQLTGKDLYKEVVEATIEFVQHELGNATGGYFSAVNADSKDGEGEFYSWTSTGLQKILQNNYAPLAAYYHISEEGNWKNGKNVPYVSVTAAQFATSHHIPPDDLFATLAIAKKSLLSERNKKEKPSVDQKILTSWNALLMTGFLDAFAALGNRSYLQNALTTARFLEKNMMQTDGKLWRLYKDGKTSVDGFLDDYAFLARAYIRLYELTFDKHWLDCSCKLAGYAVEHFYSRGDRMFFYANYKPGSPVIQKIELEDKSSPSSNAVFARVLYSLGVCFENDDYIGKSTRMLSRVFDQLRKGGTSYYASWCYLAGQFSYGTSEVAIIGKDALTKGLELQRKYLPLCLFMGSATEENLPLLAGKKSDSKTLIYICTRKVCRRPVESVADAFMQLKDRR